MKIKRTLTLPIYLRDLTTKDLHLVGEISHDIFNIPQWWPPNVKIDIKLQLAPSSFILRKVLATPPDATFSLNSAMLHERKQ